MKGLSLLQPWASLVDCGFKSIETRSWSTTYRGPLLIAASKGMTRETQSLMALPIFEMALRQCDYATNDETCVLKRGMQGWMALPLGYALCVADLVDVVAVETMRDRMSVSERCFGNYSDGRFAWQMANVRRLSRPLKVSGALGLWTVPQAIAAQARAQLAAA